MLNKNRTFITEGIVLKRVNVGETDRVVTFLTRDFGKLVGVAKGVRSLKSTKRAHLEPGNLVKIFCIKTKSMPLITQSSLLEYGQSSTRNSLSALRGLAQILEILDKLFVEEDNDEPSYLQAVELRKAVLDNHTNGKIQPLLSKLLQNLGYQSFEKTHHKSVLDYVAEITEREMKSFEYLRVK
mgnify:FL=1